MLFAQCIKQGMGKTNLLRRRAVMLRLSYVQSFVSVQELAAPQQFVHQPCKAEDVFSCPMLYNANIQIYLLYVWPPTETNA